MSKERNKPGREKRKPKKDKQSLAKENRGVDVLHHIGNQPSPTEPRS